MESNSPANSPTFNARDGIALCRSLLPNQLTKWAFQIDAEYEKVEKARLDGPAALTQVVPPGQRFVARASSLTVAAALSDDDLHEIFAFITSSAAGAWIQQQLGSQIACDMTHAWIRRQYAPQNYPPLHSPHGWHQDGALGFDFLSHLDGNFPCDALLPIVTCWIALGACGVDAPGLEFVTQRLGGLLTPSELIDEQVHTRFGSDEFWRPVLDSGDALLFRGDILHRTHVRPEMTVNRTSIELHFFPADKIPARIKGDHFVTLAPALIGVDKEGYGLRRDWPLAFCKM